MDADLYDEFGNYIGPEVGAEQEGGYDSEGAASGGDAFSQDEGRAWSEAGDEGVDVDMSAAPAGAASSAIVLHEDKQYYPDAEEVYGEAEVLVQEEDTQPLTQPIIAPIATKQFSVLEKEAPETMYTPDFLTTLMSAPSLIRNVAVAGHLHHGKTLLCDLLIQNTHTKAWDSSRNVRYTDARKDEQERGLSIKSTPVSLVLPNSMDKSYLLNLVDTPGHVNFSDEVTAAFRAVDGVVLVVDAVEGVMSNTERIIRHAVQQGLAITLVINKVDRLILDLKLPPTDAYKKLMHTIHEVNANIAAATAGELPPPLSPVAGSVIFASAEHGWSFSLQSFAQRYCEHYYAAKVDHRAFATRLWGDLFFNPSTRKFDRAPPGDGTPVSFVQFCLEPVYKLYSQILGEDAPVLTRTLQELGIKLRKSELHLDPKPLLRRVMSAFLGAPTGFVDMVVTHVPSPLAAAAHKVARVYSGSATSPEAVAMSECAADGPLMINIVKLYSNPDASSFFAFGRVLSGTVSTGQTVKVLGEAYTRDDVEDMALRTVTAISIGQARYSLEVSRAPAGNLVLLEGVDDVINKTATITDATEEAAEVVIFRPLAFNTTAVVHLSVEPLNPADLPKVLSGLRKLQKSYPLASTRVEESGEHVLIGTGELSMDALMHDLRLMYSQVEVKVSDPVTCFSETVVESSSMKCFAASQNKRNKLTMVAETLDKGLAEDIERGDVSSTWDKKALASFFTSKYGWDVLAARSVWAFGPTETGPNLLLDDTLTERVTKSQLAPVKSSIVQGFQWGCREGPLCDEPIRNVKFKLLDVSLAAEAIHRGGGQIIPAARRVAYSSFLLATPRMMEPVFSVEILAPSDAVEAIKRVMDRRRGHIVSNVPKPGTPFLVIKGFIPVMDSFGFETDLRVHTQGQAFGMQVFDHWSLVPGDPLDRSIVLRPLEPSPTPYLAREFMVKTRRRKGLSEDVTVSKYFDEDMLLYLKSQEAGAGEADDAAMAVAE